MLRKTQKFTFTLVLWACLTGAVGPAQKSRPSANVTSADIQSGSERIRAAIDGLSAKKDPGCPQLRDARDSELCAQWAAADAAREAANYTLVAVLLSFVGTILVALTFWEQRKVSRAQLRAYVAAFADQFLVDFSTGFVEGSIKMKNDGQTPAFNVVHCGNLVIRSERQMELDVTATVKAAHPPLGVASPSALNAGQETTGVLKNHLPFTADEFKAAIRGDKSMYVFGSVFYTDAFRRRHETRFSYRLEGFQKPPGAGKAAASPGVWVLTPYHNDAS